MSPAIFFSEASIFERLEALSMQKKTSELEKDRIFPILFFPTSREGLCQAKDGTIIGMYKFLLVTNFGGH